MSVEAIPLTTTWRSLAAAAERLVAEAIAAGDPEAPVLAAEARAAGEAEPMLRRAHALRLAASIGCAHPDDARAILSAALADLGAGMPESAHPFGALRADASWWADCAAEAELVEYAAAALRRLEGSVLALSARKRLCAALFQSLGKGDRKAFLARVDPRGVFQGRG